MATPLRGKTIAILATDGFEQVELTEPKQAVEQAGATTRLLSLKTGEIQGMHHDRKGDTFRVDAAVSEARIDDYDGLLLPGGEISLLADELVVLDLGPGQPGLDRVVLALQLGAHQPVALLQATRCPIHPCPDRGQAEVLAGLPQPVPHRAAGLGGDTDRPFYSAFVGHSSWIRTVCTPSATPISTTRGSGSRGTTLILPLRSRYAS